MVSRDFPYTFLIGLDTKLPLAPGAVTVARRFIIAENAGQVQPYSHSWARELPRDGWCYLSAKICENLLAHSAVTF
jgi:hypothetical protein